jgi:hypothetical protein
MARMRSWPRTSSASSIAVSQPLDRDRVAAMQLTNMLAATPSHNSSSIPCLFLGVKE